MASLLGTTYVLTTYNYHNEITAMKVAGLEITSVVRPIVFIGFIIGVVSFFVSDQIVPRTSPVANQILTEHIRDQSDATVGKQTVFDNVTYYGGKSRLYYARQFDIRTNELKDFIVLWLDNNRVVKKKTVAQRGVWTGSTWELLQTTDYSMESSGAILGEPLYRERATYPEIRETPEEFRLAASEGASISYRDLKEHINKLKENGIKLSTELVSLNYKLASPWSSLIVMFMTIPLLARTSTRRMVALNILMCIAFIFLFHVSGAVMLALGQAEKLIPIVSAWAHSFIFGIGTFMFLDRANY